MNIKNIIRATFLVLWTAILTACTTPGLNDNNQEPSGFKYTLSSGLFSLPQTAKSVDWAIINSANTVQKFRVTIYRSGTGEKSIVDPGPISKSIGPSHYFHNANSVGYKKPFSVGFDYEVVIELNSLKVLPSVEVWSNHGNAVIPGTLIGPTQFVDISE
jgi:hypothetical protein